MIKSNLKLLQYEKEQMERELDLLLNNEFPSMINAIKQELNNIFSENYFNINNYTSKPIELVISDENPNIKGSLLITEDNIIKMDLIAQMALFNNKHLFQIKLTKNKFYHLEQIARLKFYLESLLDEIALISKKHTKQEIFNTIQNMLYVFDKSILCFNKPDLSTLFPEKLTENNIITPSLPNDLIIQFHIKGECINIDFINYLPVIASRKGKKKTVIVNQREYEINDYLNLTIPHPGLSYLLKFLEKVRLELLTFISHLESF